MSHSLSVSELGFKSGSVALCKVFLCYITPKDFGLTLKQRSERAAFRLVQGEEGESKFQALAGIGRKQVAATQFPTASNSSFPLTGAPGVAGREGRGSGRKG